VLSRELAVVDVAIHAAAVQQFVVAAGFEICQLRRRVALLEKLLENE